MSANMKRALAYAYCAPIAIMVGFCCTAVAGFLFDVDRWVAVTAGAAGFVLVVTLGVAVIGPFDFKDNDGAGPNPPRQGAPTP
ncbi:hypothetical protein [Streptomyces collinus]|uniref:hypothetical protein n=1 Tax=Streptomyces collinus TaxID=42684 RepID=UPI0037990FFA